tara:strand:- start:854 stop:1108 length:255 start_codon:yes stop_codon:yes gene_type:complete
MKAKDRAKKLIQGFTIQITCDVRHFPTERIVLEECAKQCALICVEEVLDVLKSYGGLCDVLEDHNHWQEVKQEILNQTKEDELV